MTKPDRSENRHHIEHKEPLFRGPLRFGIDIDGTISQAPLHFKQLIDALLQRRSDVFIITGRREHERQRTLDLLDGLQIKFTKLVMRPDAWPDSVADFKVKVVQEEAVHMMIDDTEETCWAIEQRTHTLAAHMLPIPETPEARVAKAEVSRAEREKHTEPTDDT